VVVSDDRRITFRHDGVGEQPFPGDDAGKILDVRDVIDESLFRE
jgi:hypothetical protein